MGALPHVIGAIDGKYAAMGCPKSTGLLYQNHKGFLSQILFTVYGAK